jgi:hypothetical protein
MTPPASETDLAPSLGGPGLVSEGHRDTHKVIRRRIESGADRNAEVRGTERVGKRSGLTLAGLELERRLGSRLGPWGERAAGVLLVLVGVALATGLV